MAVQYPGQVQCIFLRNTSSTDPGDKFPYNTEGFKSLNQNSYMFFKVPDDLMGLDIVNGQCLNTTIPQNLTFDYQGLPFGLSSSESNSSSSSGSSSGSGNGAGTLLAGNVFERLGTLALLLVGVVAFNTL